LSLNFNKGLGTFIRLTPFDTSTSQGLANERYRRATLTTVTSVIAKSVSVLTGLITVPLTLNYLGTERYGLWMTISSIMVMMAVADFGLGNGLVNAVSQSDGRSNREAATSAVSSTFFMLSGVAALFSLVFWSVYSIVPWSRVFNVNSVQAVQEAGPTMAVFFICFALNLPLGIVQRVQIGYQEGFLSNIWQILGNVLGLVAVVIAIQFKMGLPWLLLGMSGVPTLIMGINWLFHFFHQRPWLLPRWSHFDWKIGKALLGTGAIFMVLAIVNILGTSADNIIIAQTVGSSAVATYAVVQRLFSVTFLVQMVAVPLWPAFSEALAKHDYVWVSRAFDRIHTLAVVLTLAICLTLLLLGQQIISFWAGPQIVPSFLLLAGYASYRVVTGSNEVVVALLSTERFIRWQLFIAITAGLTTFILKILMASTWQATGVAWAGAIGYGVFYVIPAFVVIRRILPRTVLSSDPRKLGSQQ